MYLNTVFKYNVFKYCPAPPWMILVITGLLLLLCSNTKYCNNLVSLHFTNYIDTLH